MKFINCLAEIPQDLSCFLYGAGSAGTKFLNLLKSYRNDIEIISFIDSNKSGEINDLPILPAHDFFVQYPDAAVIITTEHWYEVEQFLLKHLHFNYILVPPKFFYNKTKEQLINESVKIEPKFNPLFNMLFNGNEAKEIVDKLKQVENLLAHDEDKALYRTLTCQNLSVNRCKNKITEYYFCKKPQKQYHDFVDFSKMMTIIEGGVFDGIETLGFLDKVDENCVIYGFEPYIDACINGPYKEEIEQSKQIKLIEKGLWSSSTQLTFNTNGSSSCITQGNEVSGENLCVIHTTSIDEFVTQNKISKIDFIKLDIEGAEPDALKGAFNTLVNHRPQLAICIYHKQSDFYEIPLYLNSILTDYSFRLGHYIAGPYESVWYAIPNEIK